jgi:hypothetical protein
MKKFAVWVAMIVVILSIASPALATSGSIGIYSVAACRDGVTVAVSGTSDYGNNRVRVRVYKLNNDGVYVFHKQTFSGNFGSGDFLLPITVNFSDRQVGDGTSLRVDVQLQRGFGGDIGLPASAYVTAADQLCIDRCSITITTGDRAPANGVITVRSHFGSWFRPEGWTHAVIPVMAGQALHNTVVGAKCDSYVRVWYYPATGKDRTPKMLPSQYWPYDEFGASTSDGAIPYATSFARGLPATKPLESDDPYAPK